MWCGRAIGRVGDVSARFPCSGQHGQNVALAEDEKRLAVDRDFSAAVFPVQNLVADLHFHRHALAVIEPAWADGEDLAFLRFSLAVSGMNRPPRLCSAPSSERTTTRSASGPTLTDTAFFVAMGVPH